MVMKSHLSLMVFGALALLTVGIAPPVSAENWEYREDLGGWLDNETGLVWAQGSANFLDSLATWDGAMNWGLNQYRQLTGISAWRMPTLAEVQTAYSHNAWAYFQQNNDYAGSYWTSTQSKNKKEAYRIWFDSGATSLIGKNSAIKMMPVYRP
jgi:hypothetical protein